MEREYKVREGEQVRGRRREDGGSNTEKVNEKGKDGEKEE